MYNRTIGGVPVIVSENEMERTGTEWVMCFFCEKTPVKFVDGKGQVVLGERRDDPKSFGTHAHCGCLEKDTLKKAKCGCPREYHMLFEECRGY